MHARQQIRQCVVETITNLASFARVVESRRYVHEEGALPALSVFTNSESVDENLRTEPLDEYRRLIVTIEVRDTAVASLDDTLDTLCEEVEIALYADQTLNGLVKDFHMLTAEYSDGVEGKKPIGLVAMNWEALYRVLATDPTELI